MRPQVTQSERRSPIRPRNWFRIPTPQTREQQGSSKRVRPFLSVPTRYHGLALSA